MFHYFLLVFVAFHIATGRVIPRVTPPPGWDTKGLELYNTLNRRYLTLQCEYKLQLNFYNSCCHPLSVNETISSRPANCQLPSNTTCGNGNLATNDGNITSSAAPVSPTSSPSSTGNNAGGRFTGGVATYFYQNGNAGACGQVHQDTDFICAINQALYGDSGTSSPLCGQQVQITNTDNGNTVTVTIADDCPTCLNGNSIDLSVAAFGAISDLNVGQVPISWSFIN